MDTTPGYKAQHKEASLENNKDFVLANTDIAKLEGKPSWWQTLTVLSPPLPQEI